MTKIDDETISNSDLENTQACAGDSASTESSVHGGSTEVGQAAAARDDRSEDGFDVQTHGGGSVEHVENFPVFGALIESIGTSQVSAVPGDAATLPCASSIEHGEPAESVCGDDDRTHVDTVANIPWRMICQLIMTHADGRRSRGTGWFISPRTVMTAGHCVFSRKAGGWVDTIEVIPGMNGTSQPFGAAKSSEFRSVKGWVKNAKVTHDYGCIILPESEPLGDKTGWFGFADLPDDALTNLLANNSGYAGDKTFGTQWFNSGRITTVTQKRLHYMLDTAPGQSGSPAWRFNKSTGKRHVVGIHNYGGCANKSTRINSAVYGNMQKWKSLGH